MKEMWESGRSLKDIGAKFGISKEAVNYRIRKLDNVTPPVSMHGIAVALGVSPAVVKSFILPELGRKPTRTSGKHTRFPASVLEEASTILDTRVCRTCKNTLPPRHHVYCSPECRKVGQKYVNLDPESKKKRRASIERWKLRNPEKARVITQKAQERYRNRQTELLVQAMKDPDVTILPVG